MNTPRSKPPIRYGQHTRKANRRRQPDGGYASGLYDDQFIRAIGRIAVFFPLLENDMIDVLGDLLGQGGHNSARQIFASINSHNARVKVMTSLLEHSRINKDKGTEYDQMLIDFQIIAGRRNDYVHQLWWTHSSGRVFLAESGVSGGSIFDGREVKIEELEDVLDGIADLMRRVREKQILRLDSLRQSSASQDKHLQPHAPDSAMVPPAPHTSGEAPLHQPRPSPPSPQFEASEE